MTLLTVFYLFSCPVIELGYAHFGTYPYKYEHVYICLLYTSDAADETDGV